MTEDSDKTNKTQPYMTSTVRVLTLMVAILIVLFAATNWYVTSSEDQKFLERYVQIEPGMPETAVVSLLGTPNDRSAEFYLDRREGNEQAYERAAESGAVRFLIWRRGRSEVYTVGLDDEGNVVIAEAGGN